jgi:carbamoyl-phosphate synthase large subunit
VETIRRIKKITREIAAALSITGPFNIQFLAKDNDIKVIECNLRASRSFPFVSKILKINFIELATKVMLGIKVEKPEKSAFDLDYVGIKASQFSFSRLQNADPVLGVDMASTGEVGCIGRDFHLALLTAMLSSGYNIPKKKNVLLSSGPPRSKMELLDGARLLTEKGYTIYATGGTHRFLADNGIPSIQVHWPDEKQSPNALELLREKKIDLVINIPKNLTQGELRNDYTIRRSTIDFNVPLITNARLASAFIQSFCKYGPDDIEIKSWEEYE